ncbi:MAG: hypothetical protein HDQ88_09825 [Clostridia bacterium]|nr:hypothetical protein [Clostridia bacterium]
MTFQERIDKTEKCRNFLQGIDLTLDVLLETRFPSWEIRTAKSHVRKAMTELDKDIEKLKQMSK